MKLTSPLVAAYCLLASLPSLARGDGPIRFDALQRGDRASWAAQFEPGATLYDDGRPKSLAKYSADAVGYERFTSLERISPDGLEVIGSFHSDLWGDFKTSFRFHLSSAGKIVRLDIGQAW